MVGEHSRTSAWCGQSGGKVREEVVAEAGERAKGGSPREEGLLQVSAGTM